MPVAGAAIGGKRSCTVLGLSAVTAYQFQLVAFRGTLNVNAVFGSLSNVASGTTATGPGAPSPAPVASVAVSPATVSQMAGTTQQLTATLKDVSGKRAHGPVRDVGLQQHGRRDGQRDRPRGEPRRRYDDDYGDDRRQERDGDRDGDGVAPAPPPGGWTNEPTGATVVSDYGFNDLFPVTDADVAIPGGSGWNSVYNGNGYMTRVSDPTAPSSPSNVVQFLYPTGFPGTKGPATAWRPLPGLTRAYVGQWWKVSNPWQGNASSVNKIGYLVVNAGSMFLAMYGPPGGPYELRVFPQFTGVSQDVWLTPNVAHVPVVLGCGTSWSGWWTTTAGW